MKKKLLFLLICFSLIGCDSNIKKENEKLKKEIETLKTENEKITEELTGFRTNPEILLAKAEDLFNQGDLDAMNEILNDLVKYHPNSEARNTVSGLASKLNVIKQKEEADRQREIELENQKRLQAVNKLRKKYDDIKDITWYRNPYFTHNVNTNRISIYMGETSSSVWLRLQMSYQGSDWIFFKNAYLSYEGNTKEIFFDEYENKETEVGGGGVWEWIDVIVDDSDLTYLELFAKSNDAKMRLTGKYTKTRNLTKAEKDGILDVLLAYDVLKNQKK